MPRAHRAHAEWTPSRLIRWAERTGPATGQLVAELLRRRPHPEQGYRTIQNILAAAQDRLPLAAPPEATPTPMHANIRGATYYAPPTPRRTDAD